MILQRVKLTKLKTDDGRWDLTDKKECPPIGFEFWVEANSWAKRFLLSANSFPIMSVMVENSKIWIPVEVLEFMNVWESRS